MVKLLRKLEVMRKAENLRGNKKKDKRRMMKGGRRKWKRMQRREDEEDKKIYSYFAFVHTVPENRHGAKY